MRMGHDSIRRNLDETILEEVLDELSSYFVNDLPEPPENLFKYTSRRVNPEISNNISYELGNKMIKYRLSDKEYFISFLKIVRYVFNNKKVSNNPKANILLAQTGAGKSKLRELIIRENPSSVIINSDKFKKFRNDVDKILKEDAENFGALTGIDSYDHANDINTYAIKKGYDILIECAPSVSKGLTGVDIDMLNDYGYNIKYHALAVGNLVSAIDIHKRYENDINNPTMKGEAKLTDIGRHNDSYAGLKNVMENINQDQLEIYRRGTKTENYIPYKIYTKDKIHTFKELQYKSNIEYINTQIDNGFKDYNYIKQQMCNRNASNLQLEQLEEVKKMMLMYYFDNAKTSKEEER